MEHKTISSNNSSLINRNGLLLGFFFSFVSVKGLSLVLPTEASPVFQRTMPKSALWILLFLFLWMGMEILPSITDKKEKETAFKLSLIFFLCNGFGYFFRNWGTVLHPWNGLNEWINFICYLIGSGCLIWCFILFLTWFLQILSLHVPSRKLFKESKFLFLAVTIMLIVTWFPWFAHQAPGITSPDSDNQIRQVMGELPLSNNHPVFHTLWIKLMFWIGGTAQKGVILYSVTQILFSALIFAWCVCYIDSTFKSKTATAAVILWFAFYPVYPLYSMTMWKDIPFALWLLVIVINISTIMSVDNEKKKRKLLNQNVILFLILCFLRHNGILVFIPTAIVLYLKNRKIGKAYVVSCTAAIVFYLLFLNIGIPLLKIRPGRGSEGFSIPLQQIARVTARYGDDLTEDQKAILSDYFTGDVAKHYRATLSDKVKENFNEKLFAKDPVPLLELWADLGKNHPWDYVESILNNSFGFWYPKADHATFVFDLSTSGLYEIHEAPLIRSQIMRGAQKYLQNMKYFSVPVLSWLFSPALGAWILIFAWYYLRMKKDSRWVMLVPLMSLWIQMFGSPAYAEYRYVYGLYTCLPLMICAVIISNKDNGD